MVPAAVPRAQRGTWSIFRLHSLTWQVDSVGMGATCDGIHPEKVHLGQRLTSVQTTWSLFSRAA